MDVGEEVLSYRLRGISFWLHQLNVVGVEKRVQVGMNSSSYLRGLVIDAPGLYCHACNILLA